MAKISEGFKKQIFIIGLTGFSLFILVIFMKVAEWLNLIDLYVGGALYGLTQLDTWLVICIFPFGFFFYFIYYILFKYRGLEID